MRSSLRKKNILIIVISFLVIIVASVFASYEIIKVLVQDQYKQQVISVSETAAAVLIPENVRAVRDEALKVYNSTENKVYSDDWGSPEFDEYVSRYSYIEDMHEFNRVISDLHLVQDRNNVDCIYITAMIPEDKNSIYLIDAADEDACMPGVLDPIYEVNYETLEDPERGFPAYVTNTDPYGWLVSGGVPIKDGNSVVGYCMCDISMASIMESILRYTIYIAVFLLIISAILVIVFLSFMEANVNNPLRAMTEAACNHAGFNDPKTELTFSDLDVKTGDEIQMLAEALKEIQTKGIS
ncbi:MAG: hypothetical protein K6B14_10740 [Lachnospiraceae bacterium]|nr:hypothetical protein [Lachnospiraceae bacterium]